MICPNCNTSNTEEARFCKNCGSPLPVAQTVAASVAMAPAASASAVAAATQPIGAPVLAARGRVSSPATPDSSQSVNILLILLSVEAFFSLIWFIIQKVVVPMIIKNDYSSISTIYKYCGWVIQSIVILGYIACSIIVKDNRVRTFLLIFLFLKIAFMIGYQINY
ncbi:MAG: zinc ribbon domain-containing protein [Bacteroidetes bacterium]|nr:zinc ribbon domain-containing protein [Bacteroidota bacterium]